MGYGWGSSWGSYTWGNRSLAFILARIQVTPSLSAAKLSALPSLVYQRLAVQQGTFLKGVNSLPPLYSASRLLVAAGASIQGLSIQQKTGLTQASIDSLFSLDCISSIPETSLAAIVNTAVEVL
jgi:hypothetical protein